MQRTDFHFELPAGLIAQRPVTPRSASRLLVLDGASGVLADRNFRELPRLLRDGDVLVFNDTRVVPARVHGTKDTGGKVELLLERAESADTALVQARSSKGLRPGATLTLPGGHSARMLEREGDLFRLKFSSGVLEFFEAHGEVPLPPYIVRLPDAADREQYQTVYARIPGAVAAPTAGLHFDEDLWPRSRPAACAALSSRCTSAREPSSRCVPRTSMSMRCTGSTSRWARAPAPRSMPRVQRGGG